ncbi:acetylcholinesterase collagenic tail peptide-like [Denticeps clupeoides]|uniref:acetylcholinesterase collagenic tail peptide-like n=1 Tax=Denticeps clupeoides TaxID=299321 RepID=UPI0010A2B5A2|nr:acetylcholinesterase collagenic tail peptide-like [Denticeps clupeoides]
MGRAHFTPVEVGLVVSSSGDKGRKGDQGTLGESGSIGNRGFKGQKGIRGLKGYSGLHGPLGPRGIPGGRGRAGTKGRSGPHGLAGRVGTDGFPGHVGKPGVPGTVNLLPGPEGERGFSGPPTSCNCSRTIHIHKPQLKVLPDIYIINDKEDMLEIQSEKAMVLRRDTHTLFVFIDSEWANVQVIPAGPSLPLAVRCIIVPHCE